MSDCFDYTRERDKSAYLTQLIGSFQHISFELRVIDVAVDGVADAQQLVSIEDDKFGVGHENLGRLVMFDRLDERIDSVAQVDDVSLHLVAVEFDNTPIVIAHLSASIRKI